MGSRANILTIENGQRQLHHCHWCASTLPRDLFFGPDYALRFAARQRVTDRWLDTVWSEGGAVIDADAKVLLFYGGDAELVDVPYRRVLLALYRYTWPSWDVRWAYRGVVDLAAYAGMPVHIEPDPRPPDDSLVITGELVITVGSVVLANGETRLFALENDALPCLRAGESLLRSIEATPGAATLDLSSAAEPPMGGFHIDVREREVSYWFAREEGRQEQEIIDAWPGWRVTWHRDAFEQQVASLGGRLVWPSPSPHELLQRARTMLLSEFASDGPASIEEIVRDAASRGEDVSVNPRALQQEPQSIEMSERIRIVDAAITQFV